MRNPTLDDRRSGQAIIFVVLVLVVLAFVMIWNFDLHKTIFVKMRGRDASDAGALAAARWQGATLNLIGELNVMQAALLTEALARGDTVFPEAEALHELRTRLNFVGPAIGLVAANQAAKNNGIYVNPFYTSELQEHAQRIRDEYALQFVPPWPVSGSTRTAWDDVADMLETIAQHGLALQPDNPSWFVDYSDRSHPLLTPAFYDAVASRNWCWFFFQHMSLLDNYRSWRDWPALPNLMMREPINSEVFSLHLTVVRTAANMAVLNPWHPAGRVPEWTDLAAQIAQRSVSTNVVFLDVAWHVYDPSSWYDWTEFIDPGFPFDTPVREQYNVLGADAVVRLSAEATRRTPGLGTSIIRRTAAAKPFGLLPDGERVDAFGMVLPGFTDVRLIPMDTSTAPEGGQFDGWAEHLTDHLPRYMNQGPTALEPGCYYCQQLNTWENDAFRQQGRAWLELYSQTCRRTTGPGPGPGGGSRIGH